MARHLLGAWLILCSLAISAAPAAAAVPSDQLFPNTTAVFISVPDVDALRAGWNATELGKMFDDPIMKPFMDDLNEQLRGRMAKTGVKLGIIAPDGRDGMISHARQFADAGIPFVFDPGQGLPMFGGDDLLNFLDLARWCTVNDYEARLLCERTGLTEAQIAERVEALIVTRGAEGSRVYAGGSVTEVACVPADALADPTGCGDAYRGGLLYGLSRGADIIASARLASVMGSIKIASRGGQNHLPTREDIAARHRAAFGTALAF